MLDTVFQCMETQGTLLKRHWHLLLCSGRRGGGSSVAAIEKIMKLLGKFAADLTQIFRLDVIPGLVLLLGDIEYGPGQKPGKESFSICGGMEAMLLESGVWARLASQLVKLALMAGVLSLSTPLL